MVQTQAFEKIALFSRNEELIALFKYSLQSNHSLIVFRSVLDLEAFYHENGFTHLFIDSKLLNEFNTTDVFTNSCTMAIVSADGFYKSYKGQPVLPYPFTKEQLLLLIKQHEAKEENEEVDSKEIINILESKYFEKFIGGSKKIIEVKRQILNSVNKINSFLLLGESGVGKTMIARFIHDISERRKEQFVVLNMAELKDELAESSLFGAVRGAYTGAVDRNGFFTTANGGTIFLDEVSEISMNSQAKLLRVLETGKYRNIGSDIEKTSDVAMIFATNVDLKKKIAQKEFREDLFYRIADFPITLPPLREHKEDIPLLVLDFLQDSEKTLSEMAMEKLLDYNWPGNVRQLKSCLSRACVSSSKNTISDEHIIF